MQETTLKPTTPAVRLAPDFHRVISIQAARRGIKIKELVEELIAADESLQAVADNEGIKLGGLAA